MSGIQKLANIFNPGYKHIPNVERDTVRFWRDANFDNFFGGRSLGLNSISGDIADGIANRHASFKDKEYFAANGEFCSPTSIWVA